MYRAPFYDGVSLKKEHGTFWAYFGQVFAKMATGPFGGSESAQIHK
jgi:hypothetical protein